MILTRGLKFDKQLEEWIIIEATKFNDEHTIATSYAIRRGGRCWDRTAREFIYEPMPSNRDDDFFARCRFESEDKALEEWRLVIKPKLFPEDVLANLPAYLLENWEELDEMGHEYNIALSLCSDDNLVSAGSSLHLTSTRHQIGELTYELIYLPDTENPIIKKRIK